ncbi:MAG: malate dehydrogenase [Candidatus Goldbacteria bacterium]|nr:malate dehydrogenase [Candidatus Goldiibacteriota bacterium]
MKPKIGIVGAGNVGASVAHISLMRNLGDIYLLDLYADLAKGKAIDLNQSKFLLGSDCMVEGGGDYAKIAECDYVVVTAGLARKPGMSRDDLLFANFDIIKGVANELKKSKKNPVVIVVSNPLDVMAYTMQKVTGFPKERVIGMAGVLDTYRFLHFIQNATGAAADNMQSIILGSHGDTMVPLLSHTFVNGEALETVIPQAEAAALADKAANGGAEIVALLKTGSAYYAPAASVVKMLEAIIQDKKSVIPCSVLAEGNFDIDGIYVGLPAVLGKNGVEKIVTLKLTAQETEKLKKSAAAIKEQIDKINPRF